jgi:hypothetical protein
MTSHLLLYELIQSPTTNQIAGRSTNLIFAQYRAYVTISFFLGLLLMTVSTVFGLLAYGNVQQLTFRTLPIIRRESDKQLSKMVLVQIIVNVFTLLPHTIANTLLTSLNIINNSMVQITFQFIVNIILLIYYKYFLQ